MSDILAVEPYSFGRGDYFIKKKSVNNLSKNVILVETNFQLISQGS